MLSKDDLHLKQQAPDDTGLVLRVTPESAGWDYSSFELYTLAPGQSLKFGNGTRETCAVVLRGAARFDIDGAKFAETREREMPFDMRPWALYAPLGCNWGLTATSPLEIAVCGAEASQSKSPLLISPGDRPVETRGMGNNVRHVIDLLPADSDVADKLLVVEAITPPGNSSSYPPHKHDEDNLPIESKLEEIYFYHIRPEQGFAFQRVYTDDRTLDIAVAPEDGDVVLVPRGYHPVCAPHGYELYYLNVMAGPKRAWKPRTAPEHAWLLDG